MASASTGGVSGSASAARAVSALIAPDSLRADFHAHERLVTALHRAVKPSTASLEFTERVSAIAALGAALRAKLNPNAPDISGIMGQISGLLDESITGLSIRDTILFPLVKPNL